MIWCYRNKGANSIFLGCGNVYKILPTLLLIRGVAHCTSLKNFSPFSSKMCKEIVKQIKQLPRSNEPNLSTLQVDNTRSNEIHFPSGQLSHRPWLEIFADIELSLFHGDELALKVSLRNLCRNKNNFNFMKNLHQNASKSNFKIVHTNVPPALPKKELQSTFLQSLNFAPISFL